jgi:hypothetical protein
MTQNSHDTQARIGDWLVIGGPPGTMPRQGQVVGVLGPAARRHFRVRWDEEHESLFYPTDGVTVIHAAARHAHQQDQHEART